MCARWFLVQWLTLQLNIREDVISNLGLERGLPAHYNRNLRGL